MRPSYLYKDRIGLLTKLPFFIYTWVFAAPVVALSTILIGSLIVLLCFLGAADFASKVFGKLWGRLNSTVCMMRVTVLSRELVDPKRSYIIVANHQSLIDIPLLYGYLDMDIKWVMKQELRSVPVLGLACEKMGHIIVDRSNTDAALNSINYAKENLSRGMNIVFFPEGTRSRTGELKPFKKGAFRLAQELGLPILPIAIHGTKDLLASDTVDLRPGQAVLEFCEPIESGEFDDLESLMAHARTQIHEALTRC